MALFKRRPPATQVASEPFTYTGGKLGIWTSICPSDPRYEVFLEGEKDTTYMFGVDRQHTAQDNIVDSCLIGREHKPGWNLVAPGIDGSPRHFPFVAGRCRFAWAVDRPKVWLVVDGVPVAAIDFEAQKCWCASGLPRPTMWSKELKDWKPEAMEGWPG